MPTGAIVPFIVLAILCWPFLEIAAFIYVGEHIGILATIGLTILSSVLGALLLRLQGLALLRRMQSEIRAGRVPASELGHGALITLAAFFLLIPGFVGDVIGLLLFLPPVRALILGALARNIHVVVRSSSSRKTGVVDLDPNEWHEVSVSAGDTPHPDGRGPRRLDGPQA